MNFIRRILGAVIVLASLPIYMMSSSALLLVTIGGWTSDNPSQPLSQHILARLMSAALFFSNVAMTMAGVQILRNKTKIMTYLLVIAGLFSASQFYGLIYSQYTSPFSRLNRGDNVSVIKHYSEIIEKDKSDYAYQKRGEIYYGMGEYDKALSDFRAINGHLFLILGYVRQSDYLNALATVDEWSAVAEKNVLYRIYHWKGMLYFKQGKFDLAVDSFKSEIELAPQASSYICVANSYAKLGLQPLALEYFEQALMHAQNYFKKYNSYSDVVKTLVARGNFYRYTKQVADARRDYQEAIQKDPRSLAAMNGIATLEDRPVTKQATNPYWGKDPTRVIYDDMGAMDGVPSL